MKCLCCHHEFSGDVSRCPVCQFPVVFTAGGDGADVARKNAQRYRDELLGDKKVSVVGYHWKQEKDEMKLLKKVFYPLAAGTELGFDAPRIWSMEKFARNTSRDMLELTYRVQENDGEKDGVVTLPVPAGENLWQIGAELCPGLKLRFLLKCGENVTYSDEISLI